MQTGVGLVNNAGEALDQIIGRIGEINGIVAGIASAASDQSGGLREVNAAIASMDTITQQNAAMVEETSAQTLTLREEVERLVSALRSFKTRDRQEPNTTQHHRRLQDTAPGVRRAG